MKRLLSIAAAAVLLFSITASVDADYRSYPHWHYRNSYTYANEPLGLWQVVSYYHVKMNGSSPAYIPSVRQTAPMDCRVPYAIFESVTITYCGLDRLTYYNPDRWRVTTRWRVCAFGFLPFCADHGMNLTFKATGYITERSSW